MAEIVGVVISLVSLITSNVPAVRANKSECDTIDRQCQLIKRLILESGQEAAPELVALLKSCNRDIKKFGGSGSFKRAVKSNEIIRKCDSYSKELQIWIDRYPHKISFFATMVNPDPNDIRRSKKELNEIEDKAKKVLASDTDIIPRKRLIAWSNKLELELNGKVGTFPLGKIYKGEYNGESVYIRELDKSIEKYLLKEILSGIVLASYLSGEKNIIKIHGICQGHKIVTAMPKNGPLSEYKKELDCCQKVVIARKIADALDYMHDITTENRGIIHRDLRAANILLTEDLEPVITGFEYCKHYSKRTGERPEIESSLKRWWPPERIADTVGWGTKIQTDVYSFGVLMYEISTGKEPEEGFLVNLDDDNICTEYTDLMRECLSTSLSERPENMDYVYNKLLDIEDTFI
ncbi:hypothetical protein BGZ49_004453 [Haplosporangium sp. Z 27]|nr:hypothetical protein BGZ49_004453 [Haplosporangium sp. Z 27]